MREFFGLDMAVLATTLAVLLLLALGTVAYLGIRNRILVKLSVRNIPRRPAQSTLIIVGLMLSTVIIAASLSIGDTVSNSIRSIVLDALGNTDIRVRSPIDPANPVGDTYIGPERQAAVFAETEGDDRIDGVLPQIREVLPVLNNDTQLTEARMVVVGIDPARTAGFGDITSISGEVITVASLGSNGVLVNETAAEEIEADAGDELVLITPTGRHNFTLRAVVSDGGLAANDSRLILALPEMQSIMGREGQVNRIDISLLGGREGPADLSDEVAGELRVAFTDAEAAGLVYDLLSTRQIIEAIRTRVDENPGNTIPLNAISDFEDLIAELESDERASDRFRALIVSPSITGQVFAAIEAAGLQGQLPQLGQAFPQVELLGVDEIKQDGLQLAEFIGNIFVTFFTIFGSFSIIVGLLLIFLVFVMLAAERAGEMGIARAVGTKRRHLIQMFTFEGVGYAIGAAVIGTIIGLIAARLLVVLLVNAFGATDSTQAFEFRHTITWTSVVAGFSLGLLLTLTTVAISAFRVSKLNIVVAIRGLPPEFVPSETPSLKVRTQNIGKALLGPLWHLYALIRGRVPQDRVEHEAMVLVVSIIPPVWLTRIGLSVWRFFSPYYTTGIPQTVVGLVVAVLSFTMFTSAFFFTIFASIFLVGIGQFVRWYAYRSGMRRERADRIGFTLMGALVFIFWALPFDALEWLTGELGGGIEMLIVSGVWMVASAVWLVMYNADLIANAVHALLGRNQKLRPIVKPAIAYPSSSRFRTGLTVAMFALVIFTMMVFSIVNNSDAGALDTPELATGGYDIRAETNAELPVGDIEAGIAEAPNLNATDFTDIASESVFPAEARQTGAEEIRFLDAPVRGVDQAYLRTNEFSISHYDPAYLPAGIDVLDEKAVARAIWDRLAEDPSLAVVSTSLLTAPAGGGFGFVSNDFHVEGISQDDAAEIEAVELNIRAGDGGGETVQRTVIGVVGPFAGIYEPQNQSEDGSVSGSITTGAAIFEEIADVPVPFTTFRLKLAEGVDADRTAAAMETAFLDNSMLAIDTFGEIQDARTQSDAFGRLFQAFMGLGLVVGVASLGVLSFRAVVERRTSIGMMRAIGYKSRMIQVQFLMESVFVTVLGTALGIGIGTLLSWNLVNDFAESFEGIRFAIPWATVTVIVVIAVVAALITTFIPARQASRIFPSEALRYE